MTVSEWKPILGPELAQEAQLVINQHINTLRNVNAKKGSAELLAQVALALSYATRRPTPARLRGEIIRYFNASINRLAQRRECVLGFRAGLSGLGWTLFHVASRILDPEMSQDPALQLDDVLIRALQRGLWTGPNGLTEGLVGIGLYFLDRLPRSTAAFGLRAIVYYLQKSCEHSWGGLTWLDRSYDGSQCKTAEKSSFLSDRYSIDIPCGVLGIIRFLSLMVKEGIDKEKTSAMLSLSVSWLLTRNFGSADQPQYPDEFIPGVPSTRGALSWHAGQLAVGFALYQLGLQHHRTDWSNHGFKVLATCIDIPGDWCCDREQVGRHESLGVAHVFNRMFQCTRDESYLTASRVWYSRALSTQSRCIDSERKKTAHTHWFAREEIFETLILSAATSETEPVWDRSILLTC